MSDGYRKYLQNVIPRVSRHPDVQSILCAAPASISLDKEVERLPNVQFLYCQSLKLFPKNNDIVLNASLGKLDPDVVYVPVERYYRFQNIPVVNMIQNMEPFIHAFKGNPVSEKIKNWLRIKYAKKAINNADRIIAISQFVKNFLTSRLATPDHKIGVVYHGSDISESKDVGSPVTIPFHWQNRFLFTAGSIRPARGLEDVLYAIKHLSNYYGAAPGLVIAGSPTPAMIRYYKTLINWLDKNNLSSKVLWVGHLSKSQMAWCYQHCLAFIMTSRVEAFGQIAVEAMSHGCLCLAANNPCLPEIFSDAAVYYNSGAWKELSDLITCILSWDQSKKKHLSQRALERASQFSWDVCAEKTVEQLQFIARQNK